MMLFCTRSAAHLAKKIRMKKGCVVFKTFSDGELFVKVNENVKDKKVWVLANTSPPAENILELLFLLDALQCAGAKINLFMPYFGYARQDKPKKGEACSAKIVCDLLKKFKLRKIFVLDMHSPLKHLKYTNIVPYDLYFDIVCRGDFVVAPDKGALHVAKIMSKKCKMPVVSIKKKRPAHEKVKMKKVKKVKGKAVIIDDMISTGNTVIEAGKQFESVVVVSTHGVFSKDALKKIQKSRIKRVYVTNSLPQKRHPKLRVIDISRYLEKVMKNG